LKSGLAWLQALIPNPQAAPPEGLRLDDPVILSWPVVVRGKSIGGGPIHHTRLTELESLAGPSAPQAVTPQHVSNSTPRTFQRAEQRACVRQSRRTRSSHQPRCRPVDRN
jgi:hypothetical protein